RMARTRRVCDAGAVVLAAAAVARQKSRSGSSTYAGLNLASFRGSSELEFGADACYLLRAAGENQSVLECVKNRYGEPRDVPLLFDKKFQRFESAGEIDPLKLFDATPTRKKPPKGDADA